jgi:hypothetical protein
MLKATIPAKLLGTALILTTVVSSSRTPTLAPRHRHSPVIIHHQHGRDATSGNWSGYALTGSKGSVSEVTSSWTVPSVMCSTGDQYSAFWAGIDGYGSNTVEQTGTESDCVNGTGSYYAWYEFYPHFSYIISGMTIKPGDVMSAVVSAVGKGTFKVTLSDARNGDSFSFSTKMPNADQLSAECIAEAPYAGGVLPLAKFGSVTYSSCEATIGGAPAIPIASSNNSLEITMETSSGVIKAQPTGPIPPGNGFSVNWASTGP